MHTDDTGQQGGDSAGNGLLSRRQWMQIGAGTAAAAVVAPVVAKESFGQEPWRSGSGAPPSDYGDRPSMPSLRREQISVHPLGRKPVRHQRLCNCSTARLHQMHCTLSATTVVSRRLILRATN